MIQLSMFSLPPSTVRLTPQQAAVKAEDQRRDNSAAKILDRLRAGSATNQELSLIALRFGARLDELRAQGHMIETERLQGGLFRYRLVV